MWDVAVVGLGGVGSFALRSLARRSSASSLRIIGLERFHIGHDKGSSHGGTRIYRHAYFEHPDYVPLLKYSTAVFQTLQREMKRPIIEQCGNLIIERRRRSKQSSGSTATPIIDACLESASRHSIEVELIDDHKELQRRYPQFQFDRDHIGMIEPGGGYVRPEAAVQAAIDDAVGHGAAIQEGIKVDSIVEMKNNQSQEDDHVVIQATSKDGEKQIIKARKVIVAGGPWAGQLLPQWSKYLRVTKQVQAWIDVGQLNSNSELLVYDPSMMPTWIREENEDVSDDHTSQPMLYGFPCDPLSHNPSWMKIALHGRNDPVNADDMMISGSRDVSVAELDELRVAAAPFLQGISPDQKFVHAETCLYTCSPDENFLVGQPHGHHHVVAAAGLSGHGFKMTPGLGRALADMTVDGKTDLPIDFLCPSRFER